jgi:hypothetical protein
MPDRRHGDHCPECNTPLDTRKDDPVADRFTTLAVGFSGTAIVVMPFVGSLAFLLMIIAQFQVAKRHSLIEQYRVSIKTRRNRTLVRWFTIGWLFEMLAMLIISVYNPDAFNWW